MDDGKIQVESTETGTNEKDEKVVKFLAKQGDEDDIRNGVDTSGLV